MLLGSAPPLGMGPTRKQFLAAQASSILTVDFVHVNTVFAAANLRPVVIEHGTRVFTSPASSRTVIAPSGRRLITLKWTRADQAARHQPGDPRSGAAAGTRGPGLRYRRVHGEVCAARSPCQRGGREDDPARPTPQAGQVESALAGVHQRPRRFDYTGHDVGEPARTYLGHASTGTGLRRWSTSGSRACWVVRELFMSAAR
jgi:hypothetical protein